MSDVDAVRFRREVRRLSSRFLAQKVTSAAYLAEVKKAAVACGLGGASRRRSRDDRLLDALAWGTGTIPPGELPARLQPLFDQHARSELTDAQLAAGVQSLLAQVVKPGTGS